MARRTTLGLACACLALSAAGCGGAPPADEAPIPVTIAPIISSAGPAAEMAAELAAAGRYDEARVTFERLVHRTPDRTLRAELLFAAGECARRSGDLFTAHHIYLRVLRDYPSTRHFATLIERLYLVGKRFSLGQATKPSWLMGIEMTDLEFGIKVLTRFQAAWERHPRADDALHYVAEAQLERGEYELAIEWWEKLARIYPESEWADTAEFRVGVTLIALSDGADYDKAPLLSARARLKRYLERPTRDHDEEARAQLAALDERIAEQQLAVARFYVRRDRLYSADIYLTALQRDYPATTAAREAKTLQASLPRTSPPPPKPAPSRLEADDDENREDRLRLAPVPIDDSW